jgi:peptidyl-prolyl cis-trans isomerase B (cyclophilin B)
MIQGGDVHRRDGSSGESIYGRTFADEHFKLKFDKPGRLAMANRGKDCNHSQFFITCAEATHCNDSYVVFGEVVSGLEFVCRVASLDVDDKDAPSSYAVEIADCGLLSREEGEKALSEEAERAAEASKAAAAPEAKVAVAE